MFGANISNKYIYIIYNKIYKYLNKYICILFIKYINNKKYLMSQVKLMKARVSNSGIA